MTETRITCPACHGSRYIGNGLCERCMGSGLVPWHPQSQQYAYVFPGGAFEPVPQITITHEQPPVFVPARRKGRPRLREALSPLALRRRRTP